jgi:hypothetical protein
MICCLSFSSQALTQSFNDFVAKYSSTNGSGYMQPLADAFAADLNSGLYQTADIPIKGVHLNFSLVVTEAFIGDSRKSFQATTEGFFTPTTTTSVPTIFGGTNGVTVPGTAATAYAFPGGLGVTTLPLIVPQLEVGSLYGTELAVRFFQAQVANSSIGQLQLWGIGVHHNLNQWISTKLPVALAAGIYYQHFSIGDIVSASATLISIQTSYNYGIITFYGGPGVEISSMDVNYDGSAGKINLSLKGANSIRLTTGAALNVGFFRLFIDYNIASQSALVLGLGFHF